MSIEDESWRTKFSESSEGKDREGYRPSNGENSTGERKMSANGRVLRPRISRPAYSSNASRETRSYQPGASREGGYQPRQTRDGNYQSNPRYQQREGGYQPRQTNEDSYQPNPRYQQREGGYQPRQNNGGYQPRPRYQQQREGGYQPNPRFQQREGGYQPRQANGGYQQPRFNAGNRRQRTADYNPHAKYSMKKQIEYKETHVDPNEPIRLNKYLANAGVCSRREADEFITAGVVKVNGEVVTELGTKVKRSDVVHFHDQQISIEKKVYVLLNKPKDYVTTSDDPQNRKTVMDLVKDACRERIYPVGRLDRNTTGVLLLTNDGELASKLTHPQFMKKKIYHVWLDKNVTAADMRLIADGVTLDDGEIRADAIDYASETDRKQVGIEIHSGRNRIVRRIFESLGYKVLKLDRVFFAGLTKKNVRRGDWRFLTEQEVNMLRMGAFE
ncbi:MAG: pseudouridine synthase [Bacteroidaceae bacterium]|nr:pseudouridine synthase [Paraprevotella sp.]MDY3891132.1 pseudouridine synthase [Bacteroidaceae bacterium]MDY4614939.1 pseudouridine synthase [Bacteroidaceae bacterium]MDY5077314.1 pseudouridine synthase [Bacteroidaceae bacterium]MDY5266463.1 pseudouridine synthase [Bacteroidaceae bacterium]